MQLADYVWTSGRTSPRDHSYNISRVHSSPLVPWHNFARLGQTFDYIRLVKKDFFKPV